MFEEVFAAEPSSCVHDAEPIDFLHALLQQIHQFCFK